MRAIVETDSLSYLRDRAMEFLRSAEEAPNRVEYGDALRSAISLLALELVKNGHIPPGLRKTSKGPMKIGGPGIPNLQDGNAF